VSELIVATTFTGSLEPGERDGVYRAARGGILVPLRSGAFVEPGIWAEVFPIDRIRARARAVAAAARSGPPVFAGTTAAAEWGLPVTRTRDDRVHVIVTGDNPQKSARDVVRHHWPLPESDIVPRNGLTVTSLSRTVYDVIRVGSAETAISICDAALRFVAWDDDEHVVNSDAADDFRRDVWRRVMRGSGARGIRQARDILLIADARAQLPGESISRLWMRRLGAPIPILQYAVKRGSKAYWLDFAWPKLKLFGEFDGAGKYFDPELTSGRSFDEVLAAEHDRQADIERATGWSAVRWGNTELSGIDEFGRFLRRKGIL
jgi:hypothetical protein